MKDCIGQELVEGDYVAGLHSLNETPAVFKVVGFTPKKVRLVPIDDGGNTTKFPADLVKIDPVAVLANIALSPKDNLGQDLEIGDYAYGSDGSYISPVIFLIEGFVPRHAKVKKVLSERWIQGVTRLLTDLIKVDSRVVMMYNLTRDHSND